MRENGESGSSPGVGWPACQRPTRTLCYGWRSSLKSGTLLEFFFFFQKLLIFHQLNFHFKSLYLNSLRSLSGSSYPCSGLSSGRCKPVFSGRLRKSRLVPPKGLPAARNRRDTLVIYSQDIKGSGHSECFPFKLQRESRTMPYRSLSWSSRKASLGIIIPRRE